MRFLLLPLAIVYGMVIRLRNFCFDTGIFNRTSFSKPVIVVGNLSVGGTGKTPMIEYLLRQLSGTVKVAMLSRGYGRKTSGFHYVKASSTSVQAGDEPVQIAGKFTQVRVAVDEDRVHGIRRLINDEPELDLILLDDGFQHRSVVPQMAVVLTTWYNPFHKDFLLPVGRLREQRSSIARADVVVVTKCPKEPEQEERKVIRQRMRLRGDQSLFFAQERYSEPYHIWKPEQGIASKVEKVLLITGIARAQSLREHIEQRWSVVKHFDFRDHHAFSEKDLKEILESWEAMKGENVAIITTEKDAVRLKVTTLKNEALPIFALPVETAFCGSDEEAFKQRVYDIISKDFSDQ